MEIHHIERIIPSLKSGSKYLRFGNIGMTSMQNLSTMDEMFLFNDPKFWTEGEKDKFYQECTRLMDKNYASDGFFEKYS